MTTHDLIAQAYALFNKRDIDGTLALMSADVSWPRASEGGRIVGKQAIREYWTRQWAEFDPHVEVLQVTDRENGQTEVKVHQLVRDRNGVPLSDTEVWHVYTIQNKLIARMDLPEAEQNPAGPSAAFAGH